VSDPDHVTLLLAHPLSPQQATMVGAEPKQYRPGDEVIVPLSTAMTVINAGYAQVDPADAAAVAAVLQGRHAGPDGASDPTGSPPTVLPPGTRAGTPPPDPAASSPPAEGPPLAPSPSPLTPSSPPAGPRPVTATPLT
jgi:hypothetical protein